MVRRRAARLALVTLVTAATGVPAAGAWADGGLQVDVAHDGRGWQSAFAAPLLDAGNLLPGEVVSTEVRLRTAAAQPAALLVDVGAPACREVGCPSPQRVRVRVDRW